MKRQFALGLLIGLTCGESFAAKRSYTRAITLPERAAEELAAAPLDAEVCAHAEPEFVDLRILDSKENEVASVLRRATETRTETCARALDGAQPHREPA